MEIKCSNFQTKRSDDNNIKQVKGTLPPSLVLPSPPLALQYNFPCQFYPAQPAGLYVYQMLCSTRIKSAKNVVKENALSTGCPNKYGNSVTNSISSF